MAEIYSDCNTREINNHRLAASMTRSIEIAFGTYRLQYLIKIYSTANFNGQWPDNNSAVGRGYYRHSGLVNHRLRAAGRGDGRRGGVSGRHGAHQVRDYRVPVTALRLVQGRRGRRQLCSR